MASRGKTKILSVDFDSFANDVAMEVWNDLIHQPIMSRTPPAHYADFFHAIQKALQKYKPPSAEAFLRRSRRVH